MIIRISSLIILLFTLTGLTCEGNKIDFASCKIDTTCFVRKSCINAALLPTSLFEMNELNTLINDKCDFVLQIKSFGSSKYLINLQVESSDSKLDKNAGIKIVQGTTELVCTERALASSDTKLTMIQTAEQPPVYTESLIFCSFTLETKEGLTFQKYFSESDRNQFTTIQYSNTDGTTTAVSGADSLKLKGDQLWVSTELKKTCDPDGLTTSQKETPDYMLSPVHPNLNEAGKTCKDMNKEILVIDGQTTTKSTTLKCEINEFKYDGGKNTKLEAYCIDIHYCSMCDMNALIQRAPEECPYCTKFESKGKDECVLAKCTNDQWTLNGKDLTTGTVSCKKNTEDSTKSSWYLKPNEGAEIEITDKASCITWKECDAPKPKNCDGDESCSVANITSESISCTIGKVADSNIPHEGVVTCDHGTGKYTSKGKIIADDLHCQSGPESEAKVGTGSTPLIAGCVVVVIVILVAVGAAVYFLFMKPRKAGKNGGLKKKGGKNSKKQSDEQASSTKKDGEKGKSNKSKKSDAVKSDTNKEAEAAATPAAGAEAAATPAAGADAAATPAAGAPAAATPATPGAVPSNPATDPSKLDKVIEAEKAAGVGAAPSDPPANEQTAAAGAK